MMRRSCSAAAILIGLAVAACSGESEPVPPERTQGTTRQDPPTRSTDGQGIGAARERPSIRTNYQGEFVAVPSDAGASYRVLANELLPGGTREVVTRRDGRNGIRYARWEFDCAGGAFRRLGEGAAVDAALEDAPDPEGLSPLAADQIAADIARYACPA